MTAPMFAFCGVSETSLRAAILAAPSDDAPRLALASWLEARAEPGDADRAEFIRLQIKLADERVVVDGKAHFGGQLLRAKRARKEMCEREKELRTVAANEWAATLQTHAARLSRWLIRPAATRFPDHSAFDATVTFTRGFASSIECTTAKWLAFADRIVARQPIVEVRLTNGNVTDFCDADIRWIRRDEYTIQEWPGVRFRLPLT